MKALRSLVSKSLKDTGSPAKKKKKLGKKTNQSIIDIFFNKLTKVLCSAKSI